ncbi:MAG: diguanylate cyclase (GGDEF)-like protein/PAS domain S-box-containing protein, partial [Reinekea sp.]
MSAKHPMKASLSLMKFRLALGVSVSVSLICFGFIFEAYALISVISVMAILTGATIAGHIYSKKELHIEYLENMETINRAINKSESVEDLLFNVLSEVQHILKTDRAWLLYPCDPNAASWKVPMEVTNPDFPGAMEKNNEIPMTIEAAQLFRHALEIKDAVYFDYDSPNSPRETIDEFGVLTQIHIALFPKTGEPWMLGVHQCTYQKVWNDNEIQLFKEISRRISDALTSLLFLRNLAENEQRNRTILDTTAEAIYGIDLEGNCTFCNTACIRILGFSDQRQLIGKNMHNLIHHPHKNGASNSQLNCPINHSMRDSKLYHVDTEMLYRPNGASFPAEYWAHPIIENNQVTGAVVTFIDITDRRQKEGELSHQASHDSLTDLYNRLEFERRLAESLLETNILDTQHAMFFLDLDQFKVINDTCGHAAGDELLRQISEVLKSSIRNDDTLARIGGDEFAILMLDCTLDQASQVANVILNAVNDFQFVWEDNIFRIQICIGLVPITSPTQTISELFIQADAACYLAKDAGRNRIHIHHVDDSEMTERRDEMQWVTKIYSALKE